MRKVDMLNRSMNTLYLSTAISDHNVTLLSAHLSDRVDLRYWYPEEPPVPSWLLPSIRWTSITWLSADYVDNDHKMKCFDHTHISIL